ncbi:MAG: 16S rRNA (guanine(527)-N(7))-methyltransferase RsmG [Mollicutes bacterium]|nr:16S rRNA (guanine(527)-N(7))-methyltransferase RsmG [Mollicutes bacterium]
MKINKFINKLREIGIEVDEKKLNLLEKYYNILIEYNTHTNLTSIIKKEEVYLKHFYDSLTAYKAHDFKQNTSVIDVGSGAGFPGVVLKIFFPNIRLTIIDSNNKKTKFILELIRLLNLKDINVINDRAENYAKNNLNKYDICISRAVAFIDIISELCIPLIKKEGKVILMKGAFDEEKIILEKHKKDLNIEKYDIINCDLDENNVRNLVILFKKTISKDIKDYNTILKRNKKWKTKYLRENIIAKN